MAPSIFTTNMNVNNIPMSIWNLSAEKNQVLTPIANVEASKDHRTAPFDQRLIVCLLHWHTVRELRRHGREDINTVIHTDTDTQRNNR